MNEITGFLMDFFFAVLSAGLAFFGFWRKARAELEQEYQKRFNEKKWETYTNFTRMLQSLLKDDDARVNTQEVETDLVSQFVMIGSDDVLRAMRDWRLAANIFGKSADETNKKLYLLLVKMRNDLGIKYSKIGADDLLEVLVPQAKKS